MPYESNTGLGVVNHYGPRGTGKSAGVVKTEGRTIEVSLDIDAEVIANGGPIIVPLELRGTGTIEKAYLTVTEAFALGGTSPTILVGTDTSEATNGVEVSEAQAEAVGTYDLTSTLGGTWAAPLAADTTIGVALGGTSPTVGASGKANLVIRYTTMN